MTGFQDSFISYGRADSRDFARRLTDRLAQEGLGVWFDFDDIPPGVDYQKQIDDGIEKSDNFLFIISPHSVNSPYCGLEIEQAIRFNKRIIPLMHVMQIDRATWQQRYPQGTDCDWAAYQAEGKHSSTRNIHPLISKINWIYFEEDKNDFEEACQILLSLIRHQQAYVHQHTVLLAQALNWERHQRQSRYLLVGEERQQAEQWLKIRFQKEQPPCLPADLHCEFITESIKNANNLMAQVFLCHASEDQAIAEKVRSVLQRQGITVWNYRTDIQTGVNYHEAINRGIEEADTVVFLLSPHSAQSQYCPQEISYAQSFNKRIIPLQIAPTELGLSLAHLEELQFVDFTAHEQSASLKRSTDKLLRALHDNENYYTNHKVLLTKALRWKRQHQNPTMLLRGYNLQEAEKWLQVAERQPGVLPPTDYHRVFIQESLRQPPAASLDVFISYSRVDSDFARRLNEALQIQGKTTWFDQESIASGTDFQQEIHRGIAVSNTFLLILSPQSVNSPFCADEVEYAHQLNKRIVTLLHRPIDINDLHPVLAKTQWLDFREHGQDFQANFRNLIRTLDTDRAHLATHTWLGVRAGEWDQQERSESRLLRGQDLENAEQWLVKNVQIEPKPTQLQQEYVRASRANQKAQQAAVRKLRRGALLGTVAAVLGIGVAGTSGLVALKIRQQAKTDLRTAQTGTTLERAGMAAIRRFSFQQTESLLAATRAGAHLKTLLAENKIKTLIDYPAVSPLLALQTSLDTLQETRLAGHTGYVYTVAFSPNGQRVATAGNDGTARVWDLQGQQMAELKGHQGPVKTVRFSPNGQLIATAGEDGTARLWNLQGQQMAQLRGHQGSVLGVMFSPNGQQLATNGEDGTARLWNLQGQQITQFVGHKGFIYALAFSPNGQQLVTGGEDGTTRLWNLQGNPIAQFAEHRGAVLSVTFSPNGQQLATLGEDGTARLWNTKGTAIAQLKGHPGTVLSVTFSPNGQQLATSGNDGTTRLWNWQGQQIAQLESPQEYVYAVAFSPSGKQLATSGDDGTVRLWSLQGQPLAKLEGHQGPLKTLMFSPDGQHLATSGEDETTRLWNLQGQPVAKLENGQNLSTVAFSPSGQQVATGGEDGTLQLWDLQGKPTAKMVKAHQGYLWEITFSPDGQYLATSGDDGAVGLWNLQGQPMARLIGHELPVRTTMFSSNGENVATLSEDGTARLWTLQGQQLAKLEDSQGAIYAVSFSPNGQQIATGGEDGIVRLWTLQGQLLAKLEGHRGAVRKVAFSPDEKLLATSGDDGTARLWHFQGRQITQVRGHRGAIVAVAFSPNSQMLATSGEDGSARLWSLQGNPIAKLEGHQGPVRAVMFSPEGQRLATSGDDRTTRLWNLHGQQIAQYEGRLGAFNQNWSRIGIIQPKQPFQGNLTGQIVTLWSVDDLNGLLTRACHQLHWYLTYNQSASDEDRAICGVNKALGSTSSDDKKGEQHGWLSRKNASNGN